MVAGLLGIDTAAYSIGCVAGWSDDDAELTKNTASRVLAETKTRSGGHASAKNDFSATMRIVSRSRSGPTREEVDQ